MSFGPDRQGKIYGERQAQLAVTYADWEARAREALNPKAFSYIQGGAGAGTTVAGNRSAFLRRQIRPRMLQGASVRCLERTVLGTRLPFPVLLAPVGVQSIMHPEGERATAAGARAVGVPMVLSTVSSEPLEAVAEELGDSPRWFQLYPAKDRDLITSFIGRAEAAGYSALVVTLDTTLVGWRPDDLRQAYLPFLDGEGLGNYVSDPVFAAKLGAVPDPRRIETVSRFLQIYMNPALDWRDIEWIRGQTRLPLVLKGITHPEDAKRAVQQGVDGLIVSNHGGRQVDGAVAALDALPAVVDAVGGEAEVLVDSGIQSAADIVKALALGARAVLIGRLYAYALAAAGRDGVRDCLMNLRAELDLTLALTGHRSVDELGSQDLTIL